jgi:hypothetical protein
MTALGRREWAAYRGFDGADLIHLNAGLSAPGKCGEALDEQDRLHHPRSRDGKPRETRDLRKIIGWFADRVDREFASVASF